MSGPVIDRTALRAKLAPCPHARAASEAAFFELLFADMPGAEALFTAEGEAKCRMFRLMVDLIVSGESRAGALENLLCQLGQRHRERGVVSIHLKTARDAFTKALAAGHPTLTAGDQAALGALYDEIVEIMADQRRRPPGDV